MLLTGLAMRTTTLRLGTAVMVLPWHNPVLLAEQAATLDLVSGGRLDFGIGKGYRHNEFAGFGIPQEEAEARFEEAIEVITRRGLVAQRFSHHGRFWRSRTSWSSRRRRSSRIRRSGSPPESERRSAARPRAGSTSFSTSMPRPKAIGERIALYRAEREAHGLGFDPMQVAVARQLYVAKDQADTEAALARLAHVHQRTVAVSRSPGGKAGSHVLAYADKAGATEANALFGTPDEIGAQLAALERAGAEYVLLTIRRRQGAAAPFRARDHAELRSFAEAGERARWRTEPRVTGRA